MRKAQIDEACFYCIPILFSCGSSMKRLTFSVPVVIACLTLLSRGCRASFYSSSLLLLDKDSSKNRSAIALVHLGKRTRC